MLSYLSCLFLVLTLIGLVNLPLHADIKLDKHIHADALREEGKSLEAINLYNEVIIADLAKKDYSSLLGALTGRLLAWKHLFYKTNDPIYALFVKKEAETMLDIAKTYGFTNRMYLLHFLSATSASLLNDHGVAEKEFQQAVDLYPIDNAEKGNWIAHLGHAMYLNGKKEKGKQTILLGVQKINSHSSTLDSFLMHVWVSGAYLRLAKLIEQDDPNESQVYLNQAKEIINSDSRLVIRKQQLEDYLNARSPNE